MEPDNIRPSNTEPDVVVTALEPPILGGVLAPPQSQMYHRIDSLPVFSANTMPVFSGRC